MCIPVTQYFLITVGEIMVSVTGVEWAYTEAPPSMKARLSPNENNKALSESEIPTFDFETPFSRPS